MECIILHRLVGVILVGLRQYDVGIEQQSRDIIDMRVRAYTVVTRCWPIRRKLGSKQEGTFYFLLKKKTLFTTFILGKLIYFTRLRETFEGFFYCFYLFIATMDGQAARSTWC